MNSCSLKPYTNNVYTTISPHVMRMSASTDGSAGVNQNCSTLRSRRGKT